MIGRFDTLALSLRLMLVHRRSGQSGQAFVEYVLVLSLVAIAVAVITQWGLFTGAVTAALKRVVDELQAAGR